MYVYRTPTAAEVLLNVVTAPTVPIAAALPLRKILYAVAPGTAVQVTMTLVALVPSEAATPVGAERARKPVFPALATLTPTALVALTVYE